MAEAAVEQRPNRFFCHKCSVEISPTLPDYTCPRCQGGFIEEMTDGFDDAPDNNDSDQAAQFAVNMLGRTLFENIRMHVDPEQNRAMDAETDSDSEVVVEEESSYVHPPRGFPHVRATFHRFNQHRPQPIEGEGLLLIGRTSGQGIIQQLLASLTGQPIVRTSLGQAFGPGVLYGNPGDYAWGTGGLDAIITQLLNQLDGTGPPPAAQDQIQALPVVKITQDQIDKNTQCSICMEDFKLEEEVRRLPCNHHYHSDCIVPWLELHGTCPVCRKNLSGEDTSTLEPTLDNTAAASSTSSSSLSSSSQGPQLPSVYDFSDEYD